MEILRTLESHYKDMQDTEFTVEEGQLYMLQTRNAKRPAQAAVRFACDAVDEGLLTKEEAIATIDPSSLDALLHPTFDPKAEFEVLATGRQRLAGRGQGRDRLHRRRGGRRPAQDGRDVILVRPFTEADDVAGFHAAKGILTSEGGKASHAALVARGMGRPAVIGAGELDDRPQGQGDPRRRHDRLRGRPDRDRRHQGLRHARRRPARRGRDERVLRPRARVVRRDPPARRARQRRHARGREEGARARRRGHRPVPDRAHVHGRGPPAEDAGDDHGRRRGRRGARRSPSCSRSSRRTSRACSRRWRACR